MIRRVFAVLRVLLGGMIGLLVVVWIFGPREPVVIDLSFDSSLLGDDPAAYLAQSEARFDDIIPGGQKQIVWAGEAGARTDWAVIYIHGFSASAGEVRPLPDDVAAELGANLYFTRLAGHGRDGPAMAEASVGDWMQDMAEALAIGRALGDRVLVVSTSTGGTISAIAALDQASMQNVAGIVFISPNFQVKNPMAALLTLPAVRWWGPVVAGAERCASVRSELQASIWTICYPTVATVPMASVVKHARAQDFSNARVPALWVYSDADQVVDAAATDIVVDEWGGPSTVIHPELTGDADEQQHVIAGDVASPGMTPILAADILDWVKSL